MTTAMTEPDISRGRRRWFRIRKPENLDVRARLKLDDVKLPDAAKLSDRMPEVKMPDLKMPDLKMPDGFKLPDAEKLAGSIDLDRLNIKLPSRVDLPGGLELRRRSGMRLPAAVVAAVSGLIGAVAVVLLDPDVSPQPRPPLRDRLASTARPLGRPRRHPRLLPSPDAAGPGPLSRIRA